MLDTAGTSSGQTQQSTNAIINVAHIKKENEDLRATIKNLNLRLGEEVVTDGEDNESLSCLSSDDEKEPRSNIVNTPHFQMDSEFANKHDYITNVNLL